MAKPKNPHAAELARIRWRKTPRAARSKAASKAVQARWDAMSEEQRSDAARARWVTRRKNQGKS